MATQEEIDKARRDGFEAYSKGGGITHISVGRHRSPHANPDSDMELRKAWFEGFERARIQHLS